MKESYCSYELSVLLKEKGFNIPYYSSWRDLVLREYSAREDWNRISAYVTRPSLSLALTWLRETFRVDLSAHITSSGSFCYEMWKQEEDAARGWERVGSQYGHNTYEDAIEAGMTEVWKHIQQHT